MESLVVFLPCSNINKTTEFYRDICGITNIQYQVKGKVHIFDTGYGFIGFCQYDDGRPLLSGDKGVCISFNLKDRNEVDELYLKMLEKNVTISSKPTHHKKFPVYSFFVKDPDGYNVEFQKID